MDDEDSIIETRWLRIYWSPVILFGVSFDPERFIIGIYIGPIGIYLGDAQDDME